MDQKPKLSARDTFILDNATIDELDDMSLTSVIRDFEATADHSQPAQAASEANTGSDDDGTGDGDRDGEFVLTLLDD